MSIISKSSECALIIARLISQTETSVSGTGTSDATVNQQSPLAKAVPSKGYKTFMLRDAGDIINEDLSHNSLIAAVNSKDYAAILENKYYRILFDDKAHMISLYDKVADREILKAGEKGNVIMTYEDRPHNFEAWDVNNYYEEKSWEADDVTEMVLTENGPLVSTLKITRKYLESDIVQYISVYADSPRIDIKHEIDWHQKQIFVKLCLPVDIHTSEATFEIQYGNVKRATHYNTSWDAARFEVCMHKWVDVSEDNYGISILNDCKYGISVHDGNIGVSLLKSAIYPNPEADKEHHEFTISLLPHEGNFKEAGTIPQAYLLNNPMTTVIKNNAGGSISEEYSFVSSDCDNVIIEAVKKAEDSDDIIVRLYECYNRRSDVCLTFAKDIKAAYECDMLENNIEAVVSEGNSVYFKMKPFEIKTLKINL
jgi:alpha-mannosidase